MSKNNEAISNKVGVIPDFFHDIIAYIIPGYTALFLIDLNCIISLSKTSFLKSIDPQGFFLSLIIAYVAGRFFEQLGYMTIHHRKFPFVGKSSKIPSPKWALLFDSNDTHYTNPFKENVVNKIGEWLKKQDGDSLMKTCDEKKEPDYFNLIQFYLRERFPHVALYEKKQNATIVLTRSLAIIFASNVMIYFLMIFLLVQRGINTTFSWNAACYITANLLFSLVMYKRFQQDKVYHAMYIFETFIAMKKLLRSKKNNSDV